MELYTKILLGILIPFIGTSIGSAVVFFFKKNINLIIEKIFLGFASGVMIAASVWSLLIPSIEMATQQGKIGWLPATLGLIVGTLFLKIIDNFFENKNLNNKSIDKKTWMLVLSVTLHNIPEGMAVGVVLAGAIYGNTTLTLAGALSLAIGMSEGISSMSGGIRLENIFIDEGFGSLDNEALDNAIEASCGSKGRKISIVIEEIKERIEIKISNTYSDKLLSVEKIFEKGVLSKGKNRGLGLYKVKEIVNKYPSVELETIADKELFMQKLTILKSVRVGASIARP
jgi:hypothetical protein